MIVPLPRSQRNSEDSILPLINIVFLLLIFFMIAGSFTSAAPFELQPPHVSAAPETAAPTHGDIALAADGDVAFAGEKLPMGELAERVSAWSESVRESDQPLTLRADGNADSAQMLAIINSLREAGIKRVRLLAVGQRSGPD